MSARINHKIMSEPWRANGELVASKLLRHKLNVPNIVNYSDLINNSYVDYELIPGNTIKNRQDLNYEAGQILAKIHQNKFISAGRIDHKTLIPEGKSWSKFFESINTFYLTQLKKTEFSFISDKCAKALQDSKVEEEYVLLHGDYLQKNILATEKGISGVIDWELCCAGNSLYDISWSLLSFNSKQMGLGGRNSDFIEGYKSYRPVEIEKDKLLPYNISHLVRILLFDYPKEIQIMSNTEASQYRNDLMAILEKELK